MPLGSFLDMPLMSAPFADFLRVCDFIIQFPLGPDLAAAEENGYLHNIALDNLGSIHIILLLILWVTHAEALCLYDDP